MIITSITELIGDTPLLRIPDSVHGIENVDLYAKLEYMNPFGSVKDRVAWRMLREELPRLRSKGMSIIENSSGNTAKAIAALASMSGVPFRLVSAMTKVEEGKEMLRLLGVDIQEIPSAVECFDPSDPNDPNFIIEREVAESRGQLFFTGQFFNPKNPEVHRESTGEELIRDLPKIDVLCSGLGTSGSTLGISRRIRERDKLLHSVGITSDASDFIPGIRTMAQMRDYGFFDASTYEDFVTVDSSQALDGMYTLIRSCGMLCGPSSGANYSGALRYLRPLAQKSNSRITAVIIACDRVEWYLSYIKQRKPHFFAGSNPTVAPSIVSPPIAATRIINVSDALNLIQTEAALVVDLRGSLAFEAGTIPGAINLPLELADKIAQARVPFCGIERPVIFACPIGEQSKRVASLLGMRGAKSYSLEGGFHMWRSMGLPMTDDQGDPYHVAG
jgi:cysteine synthase B